MSAQGDRLDVTRHWLIGRDEPRRVVTDEAAVERCRAVGVPVAGPFVPEPSTCQGAVEERDELRAALLAALNGFDGWREQGVKAMGWTTDSGGRSA